LNNPKATMNILAERLTAVIWILYAHQVGAWFICICISSTVYTPNEGIYQTTVILSPTIHQMKTSQTDLCEYIALSYKLVIVTGHLYYPDGLLFTELCNLSTMPFSGISKCPRFGGTCRLHYQGEDNQRARNSVSSN
jgi:hypothetical protein